MSSTTKRVPASALHCSVGEFQLGEHGEQAKSAPFKMVARSGEAINHWYWGKIVHDLSGMQLHKQRLPIDYEHDGREVIGYANRFDFASGDLEVSGALTPYKDSDRAAEIIYKASQGVPYEASINFGGGEIALEEIPEGFTTQVNGREFAGPGVIVRKWNLRGIAVCPYGADMNTSTNFSNESSFQEVTLMTTEETPAVETEAPAVEVETAVETVEAPVEPVAVETNTPAAELSAKPTGQQFLDRFGDQGGVWFAQGKTWAEACELNERKLAETIAAKDAEIAELKTKLSASAVAGGADEPVNFQAEKRGGARPTVRIAGKKYD